MSKESSLLVELKVKTLKPSKYVLVNFDDGTMWDGSQDGWKKFDRNNTQRFYDLMELWEDYE